MYIDRPLKEYLDDLAAKKPAPGGGSAAALNASIGVSLMEMVANYTIGKGKDKVREEKVAGALVKIENLRARLKDLIDADVAVYSKLSKGMKELKKDSAELEAIYREAADVPFKICKISSECLDICKDIAEYGNKNLITDTAIAAILLEGAFFSAKFNVYINLKYIKDTEYIEKVHKSLSRIEEEMPKLKEKILERCEEVISK